MDPRWKQWVLGLALVGLLLVGWRAYQQRQVDQQQADAERDAMLSRVASTPFTPLEKLRVPIVDDPLVPKGTPQKRVIGIEVMNPEWDQPLRSLTTSARDNLNDFDRTFGEKGLDHPQLLANPDSPRMADFTEGYRLWRRRDLELYRTLTRDHEAARPAAIAFLSHCLESSAGGSASRADVERSAELGAEAIIAGSQDPLVLAYYADHVLFFPYLKFKINAAVAPPLLRFPDSGYPTSVEVRLRSRLAYSGASNSSDFSGRIHAFHATLVRWLAEETRDPSTARYVLRRYHNLMSTPNASHEVAALLAVEQDGIDPWFRHLVAGYAYRYQARELGKLFERGDMREIVRKPFALAIDNASNHFKFAWMLHPDRPESAAAMVELARIGEVRTPTAADWLTKVVSCEFDHLPAYESYSRTLSRRREDSPRELLQFGAECLGTNRFDTVVPLFGMTILDDLVDREFFAREKLFETLPFSRSLLTDIERRWKEALDHAQASGTAVYTDQGEVERMLNLYVANGDYDSARRLLLAIPPSRPLRELRNGATDPNYVQARMLAGTPELVPVIEKLEQTLFAASMGNSIEQDRVEVEPRLDQLRAAGGGAERVTAILDEFWKDRQAWSRGDWVEYSPERMRNLLEIHADEIALSDDASVLELSSAVNAPVTTQMGVAFPASFQPPFEVEIRMDAGSENRSAHQKTAGVYWSTTQIGKRRYPTQDGYENDVALESAHPFLGCVPQNGMIDIRLGYRPPGRMRRVAFMPPLPLVRVRLWKNRFEYHVGPASYTGDLPMAPAEDGRLLLGEAHYNPHSSTETASDGWIRMGAMRLRRLDGNAPPSPTEPFEQRLTYWKSRSESHPDDRLARRELAELLVEQSPEDALVLLDQLQREHAGLNHVQLLRGRALTALGRYDEARPLLREVVDYQRDAFWIAFSEKQRMEILAAGFEAPELKQARDRLRQSPIPPVWVNTFDQEVEALFALQALRELRGKPEVPEREALAALNDLSTRYREAIRLAHPGPRRERLVSDFERAKEEFKGFPASIGPGAIRLPDANGPVKPAP